MSIGRLFLMAPATRLYCENENGEKFIIWLYLLKNLHRFTDIPTVLQERIFRKVFEIAEVSKLNKEDMNTYEQSLKDKRDWKNAMDTLIEESLEKGMRKKEIDLIRVMKAKGYDLNEISELTGVPVEEIEKL